VFHLALAEVVQSAMPVSELFQVFGDVLGKKDVPGIAAIHDSLRHVDARTGDIGASAHINDPADCAAMHAHAQLQLGTLLHRSANFERASTGASGVL
jgi:hypothetical protein